MDFDLYNWLIYHNWKIIMPISVNIFNLNCPNKKCMAIGLCQIRIVIKRSYNLFVLFGIQHFVYLNKYVWFRDRLYSNSNQINQFHFIESVYFPDIYQEKFKIVLIWMNKTIQACSANRQFFLCSYSASQLDIKSEIKTIQRICEWCWFCTCVNKVPAGKCALDYDRNESKTISMHCID